MAVMLRPIRASVLWRAMESGGSRRKAIGDAVDPVDRDGGVRGLGANSLDGGSPPTIGRDGRLACGRPVRLMRMRAG